MSSANVSPGDEKEHVDEFLSPSQLAFMKRLVVVLGFVLIFGFISLVIAIIYKAKQLPAQPQAGIVNQGPGGFGIPINPNLSAGEILRGYQAAGAKRFKEVPLPPGAQIISSQVSGDKVVLTVRDQAGYALMTFDLKTWSLDGIARLAPADGK